MTAPDEGPIDLTEEVRRAGYTTARRWPGVIEADDAEQEIWVRLLESNYIERVSEMDDRARSHVLGRIGSQVASGYRDDYEAFSGNLSYGTDEVRTMLKAGLLARQRKDLDPDTETMTEFLDLHEGAQALLGMSPQYADAISSEFLLGSPVENRKLVQRSVDALTKEMNRANTRRYAAYEGPGNRSVLSNSTAHVITAHDLAGSYDRPTDSRKREV